MMLPGISVQNKVCPTKSRQHACLNHLIKAMNKRFANGLNNGTKRAKKNAAHEKNKIDYL